MPTIQLLYPNREIDLGLILACWVELTELWRPSRADSDPFILPMPVYASRETLQTRLARNPEYAYSFDVLLRICSPNRGTMQAVPEFFNKPNADWVLRKPFANGLVNAAGSPTEVNCVVLTDEAINHWKDLPLAQREEATRTAQALIEADVETDDTIVALIPMELAESGVTNVAAIDAENGPANPPRSLDEATSLDSADVPERASILKQLVEDIQSNPFERRYRMQGLGLPDVNGWDKRLEAYFWPNPACGYEFTCNKLQDLTDQSRQLAEALQGGQSWSTDEGYAAIILANKIFVWGGVPQMPETVSAETVEHVFRDALDARSDSEALMNSGWTKVAAFATAHLETTESHRTQAIWDSRVATAIIGRLDSILGELPNKNPRDLFPGIGTVPGRGGTRPRKFLHAWPSGYGRWSAQIRGSEIVRQLRDILNDESNDYPRMPMPDGSVASWTTRGVEMVLFMDGY